MKDKILMNGRLIDRPPPERLVSLKCSKCGKPKDMTKDNAKKVNAAKFLCPSCYCIATMAVIRKEGKPVRTGRYGDDSIEDRQAGFREGVGI